ncbi:lipoprotein insertase outer membrane protein LolB [Thiohalorhabdus sp.]|uniref:lipoprotein insertase outer membrane protein LolB n=1 Tax=Thiohalorhabdus sp. TaxID=3094134 RepID=UPI002FC3433E
MRAPLPHLWWAVLPILLAGCAGIQLPEPAANRDQAVAAYKERVDRLSKLVGWRLDGRVVAKGPGESGQARIRWSRSDREGRLAVRNPFGQTILEMRNGPRGLRLRDAQGGVFRGDRAHTVLRERLGWRVPVGRLADWALGLGRGEGVPADLDANGRPRHLAADGWTVTFSEYIQVDGLSLPQSMLVSRDEMQLRIRVQEWHLQWPDGSRPGQQA